jgi:hypothetical protein
MADAAITAIAFTMTAAVMTWTWLQFPRGAVPLSAWQPHPAPAVPFFAGVAVVGLVATLLLLGAWRQEGRARRRAGG